MDWNESQMMIDKAIARIEKEFGKTFGLRASPGEVFRISRSASFVSQGQVLIYTQRRCADGVWRDYTKGTEMELSRYAFRRK